ncbi:hypothetical protein ACPFP2_13725 [Micromonospora citrea]|uniref:hypothetical protein n=1 Tax=Micromonospora citrea TaxID=47855 RepID=UPI003C6BB55C
MSSPAQRAAGGPVGASPDPPVLPKGESAGGRDRTAVHPAHLMDTPMVRHSGLTPAVSVDQGALPTLRLVVDSALDGVTGRYFDRFDDARAHEQAYDAEAVTRLMAATRALVGD